MGQCGVVHDHFLNLACFRCQSFKLNFPFEPIKGGDFSNEVAAVLLELLIDGIQHRALTRQLVDTAFLVEHIQVVVATRDRCLCFVSKLN